MTKSKTQIQKFILNTSLTGCKSENFPFLEKEIPNFILLSGDTPDELLDKLIMNAIVVTATMYNQDSPGTLQEEIKRLRIKYQNHYES